MQVPQGIDMNVIREALARREGGGAGVPQIDQMTTPAGTTPTGGPNTPTTPPPAPPQDTGQPSVPRPAAQTMAKVGQGANSPVFDEETRRIAKALVAKLIGVL